MNSRQYEAMRLAEQAEKPKKSASHATLLRHLKRKSEVELANNYFDYEFENIKELKSMVKSMGWTWKEAQNCKHRHLDCFLNPTVSVWLNKEQRTKYKKKVATTIQIHWLINYYILFMLFVVNPSFVQLCRRLLLRHNNPSSSNLSYQ